jgi:hypothetical protein
LIFYRRHGANTSGFQASSISYNILDKLFKQLNYFMENRQTKIDKRLDAEMEGLTKVYDRVLVRNDINCNNDLLGRIHTRRKVVQARIRIRITNRLWRPAKAFPFLIKREYGNFSGFKSFVIDMMR